MDLMNMRKDKGFTLVEMMVVIAIMAIVSAIAVPNYISFASGMKLRSVSRDLYSTLHKTRMDAIRQNARWAVRFNSAASYQVIDCGIDNRCGTADDDNSGASIRTPTNMSQYAGVNMTSFPGIVEFYPDGTSSGGTINFGNSAGHTSQVEVLILGRIKSL